MEKLFPDMPVNSGLEKMLAVTTTGIGSSAHTLLSLSYLIIPVSLAVAIKLFHWLGPFAALAAVLVPVTALLYAEACLAEQVILPAPGGLLLAAKMGKSVRSTEFFFRIRCSSMIPCRYCHVARYTTASTVFQVYSEEQKDDKKAKDLNDLLLLLHGGAMPPEHKPLPYVPPTDASRDSNGNTPVTNLQLPETGASEFSTARPSLPQSDTSGTTIGGFTPAHPGESARASLKSRGGEDLSELNQILQKTSEALYGKQMSQLPESATEAQKMLNKLRLSIGLPLVPDTDMLPVLAAAKETACTVGC